MAIYKNITREEYNKLEGINASRLKNYFESSLNGNYESNKPWSESEAMFKGTMAHSMILEPETFDYEYELLPTCPDELWIKQSGKDKGQRYKIKPKAVKEWEENLPKDKKYYNDELLDLIHDMNNAVYDNKDCDKILSLCPMRETAVTWVDERTGMKCKALIDGLGDKLGMDLKTARDIPKRFNTEGELDLEKTAQAIKWKLLIDTKNILQFSFYFDGCLANGLELERFGAVVVKNDYPIESLGLLFSEDTMQIGRNMYNRALDNWIARDKNESAFIELLEV